MLCGHWSSKYILFPIRSSRNNYHSLGMDCGTHLRFLSQGILYSHSLLQHSLKGPGSSGHSTEYQIDLYFDSPQLTSCQVDQKRRSAGSFGKTWAFQEIGRKNAAKVEKLITSVKPLGVQRSGACVDILPKKGRDNCILYFSPQIRKHTWQGFASAGENIFYIWEYDSDPLKGNMKACQI